MKKKYAERTLAYVAGFIDADGSIDCYVHEDERYNTTQYRLRVAAFNTNRKVIARFKKWFPNSSLNCLKDNRERRRPVWRWQLSKLTEIKKLLEMILPYLIVKEKQAKEALKFVETCYMPRKKGSPHRLSNKVQRIRREAYRKLKIFNHGLET